MKKFYAFALVLLCGLGFVSVTHAQEKGSIVLDIDDVTRVKVLRQDGNPLSLQNGENTYEFDLGGSGEYLQITIQTPDYGLSSAMYYEPDGKGGYKRGVKEYIANNSLYVNASQATNGYKWSVKSFSYAEKRNAKCTIVIDDPSKVIINRVTNTSIDGLVAGENIVPFVSSESEFYEVPFTILSTDNTTPVYKVVHNGEEVKLSYGSHTVSPADGDKIEIYTTYPDVDVPIKIIPTDDLSRGFINRVTVGNQEIPADQWETGFSVKLGSNVIMYADISFYQGGKMFVNKGTPSEEEIWVSSTNYYFVSTETEKIITYSATPLPTYDITVNVDHADRIRLYKNNDWDESNRIDLIDGENKVKIPENIYLMLLKLEPGCWLETFTNQKGETLQAGTNVYINAGDVFTITTGQVERNEQIVVYIDNPSAATYGGAVTYSIDDYTKMSTALAFQNPDNSYIDPGYYILPFSASYDNDVQVMAYQDTGEKYYLYQNDVEIAMNKNLTLAHNDVVKIFIEAKPETFTVTFAQAEGISAQATDVIRDRVVEVTDLTAPLSVLTGTEVQFRLSAEAVVTANGVALTPVDGLYTATITANTEILVGGEPTALENVDAALQHNVYNIQGMLLLQNATQSQINALPAGIYIINGKTTYLWQK